MLNTIFLKKISKFINNRKTLKFNNMNRFLSSKSNDIPLSNIENIKLFSVGLLAGCLGSIVGLGGAFVVIPMLSGPLKYSQHISHGCSMAAVLSTSIGGCVSYISKDVSAIFKKNVDILNDVDISQKSLNFDISDISLDILAASCIALTAGFAAKRGAIQSKRMTAKQLKISIGLLMIAMSPLVHVKRYFKNNDKNNKHNNNNNNDEASNNIRLTNCNSNLKFNQENIIKSSKMLVVGLGSGYMAGVFGVGGGALIVPALCIFTDNTYHAALVTSLAGILLIFRNVECGMWNVECGMWNAVDI